MPLATRVDLTDHDVWDFHRLLPRPPVTLAPEGYRGEVVPLRDLVEIVPPSGAARSGEPIVTPGSIDRRSGILVRTSESQGGRSYRVGKSGLQFGDVLLPPVSDLPAIVISPSNAQLQYSSWFVALRPRAVNPAVLWALLSCDTGMRARGSLSTASVVRRLDVHSVGELLVPFDSLPPDDNVLLLATRVAATELRETGKASWWRRTRLPQGERWDFFIATRDTGFLSEGVRLDQLAEVRLGRANPRSFSAAEALGLVPAVKPADVRDGLRSLHFAARSERDVLAQAGEVLLTLTGRRFLAAVVEQEVVVARDVAILHFSSFEVGRAVAQWINTAGQGVVRAFATGAYVPHLAIADLRRIPIPQPATRPVNGSAAAESEPVHTLLEEILWS